MAGPGAKLLENCAQARNLFIAAPYIKVDALRKVLNTSVGTESLVCITRWRPSDIVVGASDVGCRTLVTRRGGSFRLHPSLHAKYYRFDDSCLIGSANLTASAMGWAPQPNLEILCTGGIDFDCQRFERELLRDSREVSDAEFSRWDSLLQTTAQKRGQIGRPQPILDSWRPSTRDPRNLLLAYQEREDKIASIDEKKAAARDIHDLSIPSGLNEDKIRAWISTCLLATPFANSVRQLKDSKKLNAANSLAVTYGLSATNARRDMETVHNWLAFLKLPD